MIYITCFIFDKTKTQFFLIFFQLSNSFNIFNETNQIKYSKRQQINLQQIKKNSLLIRIQYYSNISNLFVYLLKFLFKLIKQ